MRTALRTAIAAAALSAAALTPLATAGAAFAAPVTHPAASNAASDENHRYEGKPVLIAKGKVAVLRNDAAYGPEAWIRAVGENWKPGDSYMGRVLTVLDTNNAAEVLDGLELKLTGIEEHAPVLKVTGPDGTKSYPLPVNGQGPVVPAGEYLGNRSLRSGGWAALYKQGPAKYVAVLHDQRNTITAELKVDGAGKGMQFSTDWVTLDTKGKLASYRNEAKDGDWSDRVDGCTATRTAPAFVAGMDVKLTNGPKGAVAEVSRGGKVLATLDKKHDTAFYGGARIKGLLDPAPSVPSFQMRSFGGPIPWSTLTFPAAPKCDAKPSAEPTKPAAKPASTAKQTVVQTGAQTTVVPKGGVAAGAELPQSGDDRLLFAGGAALVAAGAAGVALALFRRNGAR